MKKYSSLIKLGKYSSIICWAYCIFFSNNLITKAALIKNLDEPTGRINQVDPGNMSSTEFFEKWIGTYWDKILGGGGQISIAGQILAGLTIIMVLYAGILYITANKSFEQTNKARRIITNTLLAIVIMIGAYGIINSIYGMALWLAG